MTRTGTSLRVPRGTPGSLYTKGYLLHPDKRTDTPWIRAGPADDSDRLEPRSRITAAIARIIPQMASARSQREWMRDGGKWAREEKSPAGKAVEYFRRENKSLSCYFPPPTQLDLCRLRFKMRVSLLLCVLSPMCVIWGSCGTPENSIGMCVIINI